MYLEYAEVVLWTGVQVMQSRFHSGMTPAQMTQTNFSVDLRLIYVDWKTENLEIPMFTKLNIADYKLSKITIAQATYQIIEWTLLFMPE